MKRALLVGIDSYDTFPGLAGCVNDVAAVLPLLARNEDDTPNFDCRALTSDQDSVTRDQLLASLEDLLAPGADIALLYFSGHGALAEGDVSLVARDGTEREPGIQLSSILAKVRASPIREVLIVLDCCFSGAAGAVPQLATDVAAIRNGVSILTASRADQLAAETPEQRGAFSVFFCGALDGGAADVLGKVTVASVYSYLTESFGAWEQRPSFKGNLDRLNVIRTCSPAVPLDQLRRLPEFFPESDSQLQLDPSYEPTAEPRHLEHEAIFAILQRCRAAKLVEPVGAEHLYFAAMQSQACRLTALGRHYWRQARDNRL